MSKSKQKAMKIGDIVARKDMPQFRFRIIGESREFDMWIVEPLMRYRGFGHLFSRKDNLLIPKSANWEVVEK